MGAGEVGNRKSTELCSDTNRTGRGSQESDRQKKASESINEEMGA